MLYLRNSYSTSQLTVDGFRVHTENKQVRCSSNGPLAERRWHTIASPTDGDLKRLAAIQLITVGKDQGWASHAGTGSYSWYEIWIRRSAKDSMPTAQWKSHCNELCGKEPAKRVGPLHPVEEWNAGDVISVWACAQYPRWSNTGEAAEVRFYKWFQPVIPLGVDQKLR